jgi:hypothetical protein
VAVGVVRVALDQPAVDGTRLFVPSPGDVEPGQRLLRFDQRRVERERVLARPLRRGEVGRVAAAYVESHADLAEPGVRAGKAGVDLE